MRNIIIIGVFVLISCSSSVTEKKSFWQKQRANFLYSNKSEFFSDSTLLSDLKHLKKVPLKVNPGIDSVCLYSWQETSSKNLEFTVVAMDGNSGPSIYYVIFNKNDSLLSTKKIAGSDIDGDSYCYQGSVFISRDTFQGITKKEFNSRNESEKFKLDLKSSFYTIESDGAFVMNMIINDSIDVKK